MLVATSQSKFMMCFCVAGCFVYSSPAWPSRFWWHKPGSPPCKETDCGRRRSHCCCCYFAIGIRSHCYAGHLHQCAPSLSQPLRPGKTQVGRNIFNKDMSKQKGSWVENEWGKKLTRVPWVLLWVTAQHLVGQGTHARHLPAGATLGCPQCGTVTFILGILRGATGDPFPKVPLLLWHSRPLHKPIAERVNTRQHCANPE